MISYNADDQGNTPPKQQTTKKVHITINNIYFFYLKGTGVFGLFKSDFIRVIQLSVQFITQTIFRYRQHRPLKSVFTKNTLFFSFLYRINTTQNHPYTTKKHPLHDPQSYKTSI